MTDKERQWMLSLSALSLLGPRCDVGRLISLGYYKMALNEPFEWPFGVVATEGVDVEMLSAYLEELGISDAASFEEKLSEWYEGTGFIGNVKKLMQLGKTMGADRRQVAKSVIINGFPYMYDFFEQLMKYEFYWPKHQLDAYEVANSVMLIRVGYVKEWLTESKGEELLQGLFEKAKECFEDYESFGKEAIIGREIHCAYLKHIGSKSSVVTQSEVWPIAQYSLWAHMK